MTHTVQTIAITDIQPDDRNANRGTERGAVLLEQSLRNYGAGRSILLDKHNRVIAGNKTLEQAAGIGLDDIAVIDSDGTKLVAVRRTDIDLDTPQGRELAIADNRTGEVGLEWDIEALRELEQDGISLDTFWNESELDALLAAVPSAGEWGDAIGALPEGEKPPFQQMTFTLSDEQAEEVKHALELAKGQGPFTDSANENGNGNALHRVCAAFVAHVGA
jgi:hypothetical protein